ncbi:CdaR family protein [Leeuwenhoekiella nanhaiensis]|uniref:YbbR-like domain-containing protein n=1 Tax=Leeuwenhoekiella nanhaiensis TaxID=1655491 RepID=A0A2G1VQI0_9FLAO|nr:YbbR-like domain-containing protein [Leeuwenhoekiella nanhaiensis]PHQ29004.1 hypothetical protein CJ305_12505 [Leeuwenhoekiella nanhaiensis]
MSNRNAKNRKANLRVFITILLVTATISVMIKLNRNFTFSVTVPLTFQNLSDDLILKSSSAQSVKVTGKASGYDYFKYRFFSQDFPIDLSALSRKKDRYYYVFNIENDALKGSLSGSAITSFKPDTVFFNLDRNFEKRVPVVVEEDLGFAAGYGSLQGLVLEPDSVRVRGPRSELDSISRVISRIQLDDVRSDQTGNLAVGLSKDIPLVEITPNTVAYSLDVDKFTEGTVTVPLQLLNVPAGVSAKVFPKRINIIFNVNLSNYEQVKSSDFRVVVDFKETDSLSTSLTPQVAEAPDFVRDIRLSESTVQYLLIK